MRYLVRADKLGRATESFIGFTSQADAKADARKRVAAGFDEAFVFDGNLTLVWSVDKRGARVLRHPEI